MSLNNANVLHQMIGQTPVEITGLHEGSEEVRIKTLEGNELVLRYEPDCCASCTICQVDGDVEDLRAKLVMCEEVGNVHELDMKTERGDDSDDWHESFTWTFVKFATVKGYVTLRWYGSSNGYYSESPSAYYNGEYAPGKKHRSFE